MLRSSKRTIWIVAIVLCGMLLVPCALGYWVLVVVQELVPLPNGYALWYMDEEYEVVIDLDNEGTARINKRFNKDENFVMPRTIGPEVDGYRVYPELVVGHVSVPPIGIDDYPQQTPGYFIIDTKADKLYAGLSKDIWLEHLRKFGIDHEPKLIKPSVTDVYFGRNNPHPLSD